MLLRVALIIILVYLSILSLLIISFISYIINLVDRISSPKLEIDIASIISNLDTKLICWISSIDYDYVGVISLTVCQYSDEGEVFFIKPVLRAKAGTGRDNIR